MAAGGQVTRGQELYGDVRGKPVATSRMQRLARTRGEALLSQGARHALLFCFQCRWHVRAITVEVFGNRDQLLLPG